MDIRVDRHAIEAELDPALRDAATDHQPDDVWKERVKWLGDRVKDAAGKTYIAALGAALLAKATEPGVDSLTRRQEAIPPSAAGRCSTVACGMDGRSVMALLRGSGGWPSDRGLLVEYDEASSKGTSSCKYSAVRAVVRFYVEHVAAPDPLVGICREREEFEFHDLIAVCSSSRTCIPRPIRSPSPSRRASPCCASASGSPGATRRRSAPLSASDRGEW